VRPSDIWSKLRYDPDNFVAAVHFQKLAVLDQCGSRCASHYRRDAVLTRHDGAVTEDAVAPGLRVGRGLEQQLLDGEREEEVLRPASRSGEGRNYSERNRQVFRAQRVGVLLAYKGPIAGPLLDVVAVFVLQNVTFTEWAMLVSNQRPLPCEGSALPLS
jgi:hypothetical protein